MADLGPTDAVTELIEHIAKPLADHPDQVRVSEVQGENTPVIELTVAKKDKGKIIGKQGRTAIPIRTLLRNVSMKARKRFVLEIIE